MRTTATNRKIRILLTALEAQPPTLIPRPEFQRRLVWSNKHKLAFIETVLLGYPFPEIYIAAGDVDPDTGVGTEMLVDGQQRITTLHQYFRGSRDLRLGQGIRAYRDLNEGEKLSFLEYEVVVRDLGRKTLAEIREIFQRINSTKYSLNAMEIHNARFDGEFKTFAEELAQHAFFESNRVFRTTEVRRMGDVRFSLILLVTIMSTYFNRDSELEEYLRNYNDEFAQGDEVLAQLERVFDFVTRCKFAAAARVWKKADLLTLLVEVHRVLVKDGQRLAVKNTAGRLKKFYRAVDEIEATEGAGRAVAEYHKAALQATNDRSNRILRGKLVRDVLLDTPGTQQ